VYLHNAPDGELVDIALLDYRTSKPPSGAIVYEMKGRGAERAREMLYRVAANDPPKFLVEDMVREFGSLGDVCGLWLENAPKESRRSIVRACRSASQDQMMRLRSAVAADPTMR
jgi:hypothetical protein